MSDTGHLTAVEEQKARMVALLKQGAHLNGRKDKINETCRAIIKAMHEESGQAWLGVITLEAGREDDPVLRPWDGKEHIEGHGGCSFVLPKRDVTLVAMIRACRRAPYTTPSDRIRRLNPIMDRINDLGGFYLCWM
jgi:hypothetical protein